MGQAPLGSSYNENGVGVPLVAGAGDFGEIHPTPSKFTTSPTKISEKGDILLCIRATIGNINWSDDVYCLGRGVAGLKPEEKKLDPKYLWHFIVSSKKTLQKLGTGSTFKQISRSIIEETIIPLPSLEEQKRIAAILDKADNLRRKRQQAIDLANQFLRSVFLDMFGDPVANPKGWEEIELKQIATIRSGVTKGRDLEGKSLVSVPYMRVANVQDGYIDLSDIKEIEVPETDIKKYALEFGDILLTEGGDPDKLGRGAVWKKEIDTCIHQNHVFSVRIKTPLKILPEFLSDLIGSTRGKRYFLKVGKQTTGIATINKTVLSQFPTLIPPIDLQMKYLKMIQKREGLIKKIENSKSLHNLIFNSLSQKAFSGQL